MTYNLETINKNDSSNQCSLGGWSGSGVQKPSDSINVILGESSVLDYHTDNHIESTMFPVDTDYTENNSIVTENHILSS